MEKEKLTREQRRYMDRVNKEVMVKYDLFADRFLEFFTEHEEPDGVEVLDKAKAMDAQWRVYCAAKNLKTEAYVLFKNYADKVVEQYKKNKVEPEPAAE